MSEDDPVQVAPKLSPPPPRDHGGGLDAAMAVHGGHREDWLDLSTGINPVSYPLPLLPGHAWTRLPDHAATEELLAAARSFWNVPDEAEIVLAPGLSPVIARLPWVAEAKEVHIPLKPTYNEYHASAWAAGAEVVHRRAALNIFVHPNNPDGWLWRVEDLSGPGLTVVDESFCDVRPEASHMALTADHGTIVLKSFGKFWGLAGLRLGFAVLRRGTLANALRESLGPWPVSGPALVIGSAALTDVAWANTTRARLAEDARRLDDLVWRVGAYVVGGTSLFRLYEFGNAEAWHRGFAKHRVLSRIFPWSSVKLRLGLPPPDRWDQVEAAIEDGRSQGGFW